MSGATEVRPDEVIEDVQSVASFLSISIDDLSSRNNIGDLGRDGSAGLSRILRWMEEQLAAAGAALLAERDRRGLEALGALGLPQHALTDKGQRRAWADGYGHAMAQLDRLDPAIVAAIRQQLADNAETDGPKGG